MTRSTETRYQDLRFLPESHPLRNTLLVDLGATACHQRRNSRAHDSARNIDDFGCTRDVGCGLRGRCGHGTTLPMGISNGLTVRELLAYDLGQWHRSAGFARPSRP